MVDLDLGFSIWGFPREFMNLLVLEEGTTHCKPVSFTKVTKSFSVVVHGTHSMFPQSAFTVVVHTAKRTDEFYVSIFGKYMYL